MTAPALAQSTEPASAAKPIPPETVALSADFEGQLDHSVGTAYFCKGVAKFVAAPNGENPGNEALLLTLDPSKTSAVGRCEAANARTERAELAEPDELRLPPGTEIWYGFRFMIPSAMKGRFAGQRLVIAQLKQHPDTCPLHPEPFGVSAASEGNPTVSFRLIEDDPGDVIGVQLAVSSDDVRKISVGQLMRHRGPFLDRWHDVLLHVKVVPRGAGFPANDVGFVEGWLDGQPFIKGLYGMVDETGAPDMAEPFGYAGLIGCTYFKYGIYRDSQPEPWTIGFDRFRRGATRQSVEMP
jgi:hypothetical protein